MNYTVSGWRHFYRYYLGWIPVQFCMVCGGAHWAGLPRFWIVKKMKWVEAGDPKFPRMQAAKFYHRIGWTWLPWWNDYCSQACCDKDADAIAAHGVVKLAVDRALDNHIKNEPES